MLIRYLLATLAAGLLAGLLVTPAMYLKTVPLIIQAETYEDAGGGHSHAAEAEPHDHAVAAPVASEGEEAGAELPFGRLGNTILANLVAGAGLHCCLAVLRCCLVAASHHKMVSSGEWPVSLRLLSSQHLAFRRNCPPCLPQIWRSVSSGGFQRSS